MSKYLSPIARIVLLFLFCISVSHYSFSVDDLYHDRVPYMIHHVSEGLKSELEPYLNQQKLQWRYDPRGKQIDVLLSEEEHQQLSNHMVLPSLIPALNLFSSYHIVKDDPSFNQLTQSTITITDAMVQLGFDVLANNQFTGKNVKVGILADGIRAEDINKFANGNNPINHRLDNNIHNGIGGSITLSILNHIVPDAEFYIAAADTSFAVQQGMRDLTAIDEDIIICNNFVFVGLGPEDNTDTLNFIIKQFAQNHVVLQAAGDLGMVQYVNRFNDSDLDTFHDFAANDFVNLTVNSGETMFLWLIWDQAWGAADTDLSLVVWEELTRNPVKSSKIGQGNGEGDPLESLFWKNNDVNDLLYRIFITNLNQGPAPLMHFYFLPRTNPLLVLNPEEFLSQETLNQLSPEGSLPSLADISTFLTIGAVNPFNRNIRDYSSQGPSIHGNANPDMVAYDGIQIPEIGEVFGTSIATAFMTAAAVVIRESLPNATKDEVYNKLKQTSLNLPQGDDPEFEVFGEGLLQANQLVEDNIIPTPVRSPTPTPSPTRTPTLTPTFTFTPTFTVTPTSTHTPIITPSVTPTPIPPTPTPTISLENVRGILAVGNGFAPPLCNVRVPIFRTILQKGDEITEGIKFDVLFDGTISDFVEIDTTNTLLQDWHVRVDTSNESRINFAAISPEIIGVSAQSVLDNDAFPKGSANSYTRSSQTNTTTTTDKEILLYLVFKHTKDSFSSMNIALSSPEVWGWTDQQIQTENGLVNFGGGDLNMDGLVNQEDVNIVQMLIDMTKINDWLLH